ncbi:uncharacterized protein V2V93DRAFT_268253 [Kockiozyma suomiensis]|uniref:uncharacterized protein n=1 Tax=Kockiozyma suomiensis TaxID=1337062 RepID=UPI0033441917
MCSEETRKCLVTGATGLLGRQIMKRLTEYSPQWTVIGTGLTRVVNPIVKLDLTDLEVVTRQIKSVNPLIVIHSAAERRPDVAKEMPDQVELLNVTATRHLAQVTADLKIPMIYISTDYVFDGRNPPYETEDETNPTNFYGLTKRNGEIETLKYNPAAIVLRVPVLYGDTTNDSESAINCLVDVVIKSSQNKAIAMDNWQLRYPTNVFDISRVIKDIAELAISGKTIPSILHYKATQRYTKYEICTIFAEILAVPVYLEPVDTADHAQASGSVTRPYDCHLSNKKLIELGIDVSFVDFKEWWKRKLLPSRR